MKNVNGIWLKNSLVNFARGILQEEEWAILREMLQNVGAEELLTLAEEECQPELWRDGSEKSLWFLNYLHQMQDPVRLILTTFSAPDKPRMQFGFHKEVGFRHHKPEYLGVRQDTYISPEQILHATPFQDTSMHVLEFRSGLAAIEAMGKILQEAPQDEVAYKMPDLQAQEGQELAMWRHEREAEEVRRNVPGIPKLRRTTPGTQEGNEPRLPESRRYASRKPKPELAIPPDFSGLHTRHRVPP